MKLVNLVRGYARFGLAALLLSTAACGMEEDPTGNDQVQPAADEAVAEETAALAGGSWQQTCRNAYEVPSDYGAPILYATCRRRNGSWRDTAYFNPYSCGPGLSNCDGHLQCGC
jgi:hypothetical protein